VVEKNDIDRILKELPEDDLTDEQCDELYKDIEPIPLRKGFVEETMQLIKDMEMLDRLFP